MVQKTDIQGLKKIGQMRAADAGMGGVKKFFEASKKSMLDVLPKHINADRMLSLALGALRGNPKLMECTTESLMSAVIVSSQLGLEPNTPLGHAYLIPFKDKKKGITNVQFIPGYRGLIDLSRRSGQIISIAAHPVRTGDEFEFEYGLDERLKHVPVLGDRGPVYAYYGVAKFVGGGHQFEVMGLEDIIKIRDNSSGYKAALMYAKTDQAGTITYLNHPWWNHFDEMGRKTAIRRLFKYLPVSIELATAVRLDEMHEDGQHQPLEDALEGEFSLIPDDYEPNADTGDDNSEATTDDPAEPGDESPSVVMGSKNIDPKTILDGITTSKTSDELDVCEDLARDINMTSPVGKKIVTALAKRRAELEPK